MESTQRGPSEPEAEPRLEKAVNRAKAKRRNLQGTRPLVLDERSGYRMPQAMRDEEADRLLSKRRHANARTAAEGESSH